MRLRQFVAGMALLGVLPHQAAALTFSFATKPGDTLTTAQATAFAAAATAWSSALADPFAISLQIGFAALGSNVLGATAPNFLSATAATIDNLLAADARSPNDATAVASLSTQSATSLAVTFAQAKAIGLTGVPNGAYDGTIEFSTSYTFSNQRNADGSTPANTYDLIGIAEHEIGHVLGFDSSIDGGSPGQTILDQFRFSGANARSVTAGATAYFSINGGAANIANFSIGGSGNYQASHWLQGTGALMDPAVAAGVSTNLTPLDLTALDVIGYDIAVPEPSSLALILIGFAALYARRARPLRIRLRRRPDTPSPRRRHPGHAEPH